VRVEPFAGVLEMKTSWAEADGAATSRRAPAVATTATSERNLER